MNRLIASRGLLQIFFALQLVIGIMFIFNYIVYKNSINGIYDKVSENNRMVIKNIIQSFDTHFSSVNNLIFNIHSLPSDRVKLDNGSMDMEKVISLRDSIASFASNMDIVEDVIVSFDDHDLAITSRGTSNLDALFDRRYKSQKFNSMFWKTFTRSEHELTVFPAEVYADMASGFGRNLMIAVDSNKVRMSNKNLMVLINVNKLLKGIDLHSMMPGASLIVMDADKNVILSTEENLDLVDILNDVYFNPSQEASLTHGNYEYNFYKSDYNGFIYINKLPYKFQNIDSVTNANRWIMYGAIVLAAILSLLLSIYLYRPVKNIVHLLGGSSLKGNDFVKIQSGIIKVQRENESLKKQMDLVDEDIRRSVFLQTLDGHHHSREQEMQMQKHYTHFFQCRHFMMAAVYLQASGKEAVKADFVLEELTAQIRSSLQERYGHAVVYHVEQLKFLALIGLDQPSGRRQLVRGFEEYIDMFNREFADSFKAWGCVSRTYESKISNCREAYRNIQDGLLYRNVNADTDMVDTEQIRYVPDLYYPLQQIEKLSNCMLSGKVDEGLQIVNDIFQHNVNLQIHHHQMVHVTKSMFFLVMKQADSPSADRHELFRLESDFIRKVDQAFTCEELQKALIEVMRVVANTRNHDPRSKLNPAFISQYIELHYMENLYLDHMAEVLDTSSKYFSNYFKKTFGVNYVEYLNKVRLSHAREYLRNTDLSIAEIGEKTGYSNSSTFTTTFKKYSGVSPSEYRKASGK
ncbi:transcriptional regulator, AraC family protein [Paenibacillus vortex V453]|uniref:Transcriptional regulator, AraC family protein n=1 Tax=Paenibacillus vortex V453 TaxID=715225 RepID=A0A2R9T0I8_9BACL|nr:AraC family transcriptional regulator [Paenibacillus vortex]EFU43076.1 transcriptional regulator, AraC family protein [Paenibacillus vortex V453]